MDLKAGGSTMLKRSRENTTYMLLGGGGGGNLHMQTGQHFPIGSVCSAAGQLRAGQLAVMLV